MRLKDRTTLITGAAMGFGRAAALLFAKEGARVTVSDVDDTLGRETVETIKKAGGEAIFVHTDVTKASDAERAVKKTVDTFGAVDILFSNAGIPEKQKRIEDIPEDEWDTVLSVNLKGMFLMAKYTIPEMKKAGKGVIITTASVAGARPTGMTAAYNASKAAVVNLTKTLAMELAPFNIRANCISPGLADTHFMKVVFEHLDEEKSRQAMKAGASRQPLGRLTTPEDVANAALFLASDESSLITGTEIFVDAGRSV
jgi:3-oxoacyl-[acyl-carrier protein] reductase